MQRSAGQVLLWVERDRLDISIFVINLCPLNYLCATYSTQSQQTLFLCALLHVSDKCEDGVIQSNFT